MIQWNFNIKTLYRPAVQSKKWTNSSEKSCLYYSILKLTKLKYFMSYIKIALLTRKRSEWGTRNRHHRVFRKIWTIGYICQYIENDDQKMIFLFLWWFFIALMELRLDFFFKDFSQHSGIYLVVFALRVFIHEHGWSGKWCLKVKSPVSLNQKSYKHNPNTNPEINTIPKKRKRLLRDIHWNQKQIETLKCCLV